MEDESDPQKLREMLETARAERAEAVNALETHQRQSHEQTRLLMEEQDRFVSRLLAAQERDLGKLRLEFEEAKTTCERLHQKLRRDREGAEKLEEELAKARFDIDRLRSQRDALRTEIELSRSGRATMQARIDQLEGNLALARAMLEDAMGDAESGGLVAARVPISTHRRLKPEPARESGMRRPSRGSLSPAKELVVPSEAQRAAVGGVSIRNRDPR